MSDAGWIRAKMAMEGARSLADTERLRLARGIACPGCGGGEPCDCRVARAILAMEDSLRRGVGSAWDRQERAIVTSHVRKEREKAGAYAGVDRTVAPPVDLAGGPDVERVLLDACERLSGEESPA